MQALALYKNNNTDKKRLSYGTQRRAILERNK